MHGGFCCNVNSDFIGFEAALDRDPQIARVETSDGVTALLCCLSSVNPPLRLHPKSLGCESIGDQFNRRERCELFSCLPLSVARFLRSVRPRRRQLLYDPADKARIVELLARTKPAMCLEPGLCGLDDAVLDIPLGYTRNKEEVEFLAHFCPASIKYALCSYNLNRNFLYDEDQITVLRSTCMEVLRQAFNQQRTQPTFPKLLTTDTLFWEREDLMGTLSEEQEDIEFTEDVENGYVLLEYALSEPIYKYCRFINLQY